MESEFITINTPLGKIIIAGNNQGVHSVNFSQSEVNYTSVHPELLKCAQQLTEYFEGTRKTFDVTLNFKGTSFQKMVWNEVLKVEFGCTASYSEIAVKLNLSPYSSRAVGMANGKNPLLIIMPCHRVIGEDGKLTGYSGGLDRKRWLLTHEKNLFKSESLLF